MITDTKTIVFEHDCEVHFHPISNELEYKFRAVGFVKYTVLYIKINPEIKEIESIQIYNPIVAGGKVQYPINLDNESILKDYDMIIKEYNAVNFNRDDK